MIIRKESSPSSETIWDIMDLYHGDEGREAAEKLLLENGEDYLVQLALKLPGYVRNIPVIEVLPFSVDVWIKLIEKTYFVDNKDLDYWTEDKERKSRLPETQYSAYFRTIFNKVTRKADMVEILKKVAFKGKDPMSLTEMKFWEQQGIRDKQLKNSVDYILDG